jgi:chorismate mutase/prephenate dehydrogenase
VSNETKNAPPLDQLRERIDAVDRDLLGVLARRLEVVSEIAEYKRAHSLPIRDLDRERQILERRSAEARQLGLARGVVESIYRLILVGSREHQASRRVEIPPGIDPKTVAIIGGAGPMGTVLARMFESLGHTVTVADLDTEITPADAAASADVVVICVPIDVTEQVIGDLGPRLREEALLMDVTSIKQQPIAAMLGSTRASVLGTHPMFGPGVHSLQGQRIVVCPGRGDEWQRWAERVFTACGMVVTRADPGQHDRAMALVQVLLHLQTQVLGVALSRSGISLEESLRFTSPAYLLELYVAARHFAQAPELYGPIEMRNPMTDEVTRAFCDAAAELREILVTRDQRRFAEVFDEVRAFFGDFADEAVEQSGFLIDRLVERSLGTDE